MSWTTDLFQVIFFAASSLALLVGSGIALWRFVLLRPLGVMWKVVLPVTCSVRRFSEGEYVYHVGYEIENLSALPQRPVRNWAALSFPGEDGFDVRMPPITTPEEAMQHVSKEFGTSESSVAPGERRPWIRSESRTRLFHIVRFKFAFETRHRGLFGLPLGRFDALKFGAATVPIDSNDIRLYEESA